jgi:hypothetical protein
MNKQEYVDYCEANYNRAKKELTQEIKDYRTQQKTTIKLAKELVGSQEQPETALEHSLRLFKKVLKAREVPLVWAYHEAQTVVTKIEQEIKNDTSL